MHDWQRKNLQKLATWFEKNQRDFPWRGAQATPYRVWIAEIMSQQTQMSALVPFFYRFMERFPTVESLARASEPDVLTAWTGLGYYSRARNVHKAAQTVVAAGGFPKTFSEWLELPGVGPYTAAAVVSQCFGVEEPVWDGNVQRVCSRLFARADAHSPAFRAEMSAMLRQAMHGLNASNVNQGLMELGATVCTPKNVQCGKCIFSEQCTSYERRVVADFPPPKPRRATVDLNCRAWIFERKAGGVQAVYLTQRQSEEWFSGMWDFPSELGGAKQPKKNFEGKWLSKAMKFGSVRHSITHHRITLEGWAVPTPTGPGAGRWFSLDELLSDTPPIPLSTTARKLLRAYNARATF